MQIFKIATLILLAFGLSCKSQDLQPTKQKKQAMNYSKLWIQIDSLHRKGLVDSSLELIDSILAQAKAESNAPQYLRAVSYKTNHLQNNEEDGPTLAFEFLHDQESQSTGTDQAILQSMLGEAYSSYLRANQWQIQKREYIDGPAPANISEWSTRRLIDTADSWYARSLQDIDLLASQEISSYDSLMNLPEQVDGHRPTLLDFLGFRQIQHLRNSQRPPQPKEETLYALDAGLLSSLPEFLNYKSPEARSSYAQIVHIFQTLIRTHQTRKDPVALQHVNLQRLQWAHQVSQLSQKDDLYVARLDQVLASETSEDILAEAALLKVDLMHNKGLQIEDPENPNYSLVPIVAQFEAIAEKYPNTIAGKTAKQRIQQLKAESLSITGKGVHYPNSPGLIKVQFKNATQLYFRLLELTPDQFTSRSRDWRKEITEMIAKTPQQEWSISLQSAAQEDHRNHHLESAIPQLPAGQYVLLVSTDEEFDLAKKTVCVHKFQVSSLAHWLVWSSPKILQVVDRKEGSPLADVKVSVYSDTDYKKSIWNQNPIQKSVTDKQGRIEVPHSERLFVKLETEEEILFDTRGMYLYNQNYNPRDRNRTHFFTDRAIYRPGQIVHFKGIRYIHKVDEEPSLITNENATYILKDANNREVSKVELRSDDFGSVAGSFAIPSDGLAGQYSIVAQGENSSARIRVEKYLRPKFEVVLDKVQGQYIPGDEVSMSGEVSSYAGYGLEDAQISYRVYRTSTFPYLPWGYRYGRFFNPQRVLLHTGETLTGEDGQYAIDFEAIADPAAEAIYLPLFRYEIEIDATDINGETQSTSRSITLGYHPVSAALNLKKYYIEGNYPAIDLKMINHDGQPAEAQSKIVISRLQNPESFLHARSGVTPDRFAHTENEWKQLFPDRPYRDEWDPMTWEVVDSSAHSSDAPSDSFSLSWPTSLRKPGSYKIELTLRGDKGQPFTSSHIVHILPEVGRLIIDEAWVDLSDIKDLEPGQRFAYRMYSPLDIKPYLYHGRREVLTEIGFRQKGYWHSYETEIKEYGGFSLMPCFYKNGIFHELQSNIPVPYKTKELTVKLNSFRDKVLPGAEEKIMVSVLDSEGNTVDAQLVATLYDQSLDAYVPHRWNMPRPFPTHFYRSNKAFTINDNTYYPRCYTEYQIPHIPVGRRVYRSLRWPVNNRYGFGMMRNRNYVWEDLEIHEDSGVFPAQSPTLAARTVTVAPESLDAQGDSMVLEKNSQEESAPPPPSLRTELGESVFFFADIESNKEGQYEIRYKMKEALTRWNLLLFAHTQEFQVGSTTETIITQKDLSVEVLAPRFLRQGDQLLLPVKAINLTDQPQNTEMEIQIWNLYEEDITQKVLGTQNSINLSLKAKEAQNHNWSLQIPEDYEGGIIVRAVLRGETHSDGEQRQIPVIAKDIPVTEALPLTVRGGQTKIFSMDNWQEIQNNPNFRPYNLSVEFSSNPAWYAVQALTYLDERTHESSDQTFTRFYANALAAYVVNQFPSIRSIFEDWKSKGQLTSELNKNPELKSVLLQETPWVQDAQNQEEAMKRIALLWEYNQMQAQDINQLKKVIQKQNPDGSWPWFPGGRSNPQITLHILTLWAHLDALDVLTEQHEELFAEAAQKAQRYLNGQLAKMYNDLTKRIKKNPESKLTDLHLNHTAINYLYTRARSSSWSEDKLHKEALEYYQSQSRQYWPEFPIHSQAMLGFVLDDIKANEELATLLESFIQRSTQSEELGMYWHFENGYGWYQRPLETHAIMIELFAHKGRKDIVEELRIWLLQNKRTNHWETSRATAWAIYALLCSQKEWSKPSDIVYVEIGDKLVGKNSETQAGHLYYKEKIPVSSVSGNDLNNIQVQNNNDHLGYGGVYLQYFAPIDEIKAADQGPLNLRREIFVRKHGNDETTLRPWSPQQTLNPGDQIVVRLYIDTDREMEYLHLMDYRAAGTEPEIGLSGYHWKSGLNYYQSTDDVGTHFFIEKIQPGQHILEHRLWVRQQGEYAYGHALVEGMYAPEFRSHTEGLEMKIVGK